MSLHQDIKDSINKHFGFLQALGFSDFKEEQRGYEFHFCCYRDNIKIDIEYEPSYLMPIWIRVNGMYIEQLERENQVIKNVNQEKNKLYDANFKHYLKIDDTKYLGKNKILYDKFAETLNDQLIGEVANILQRNKSILSGDLSALKKASDESKKIQEAERVAYLKDNKIYTCEYTIDDGLVCECEGSLDEIEEQLTSIKKQWKAELSKIEIEIVDWHGNIVERRE